MKRASIFAAGLALAAAATAASAPKLELKPCTTPGLPPEPRCGTYEVRDCTMPWAPAQPLTREGP